MTDQTESNHVEGVPIKHPQAGSYPQAVYAQGMPGMPAGYYGSGYAMNGVYRQQTSYKSQQEALKLVRESVQSEKDDEQFYDYLISVAPTREEKEIITSIRDDEKKHNRMFRSIYRDLTGQTVPAPEAGEFQKPATYLAGIRKAFFGELAAVERYRDIHAGMPNRYYRDMVFEILTDEQKHADKFNFILIMNVK